MPIPKNLFDDGHRRRTSSSPVNRDGDEHIPEPDQTIPSGGNDGVSPAPQNDAPSSSAAPSETSHGDIPSSPTVDAHSGNQATSTTQVPQEASVDTTNTSDTYGGAVGSSTQQSSVPPPHETANSQPGGVTESTYRHADGGREDAPYSTSSPARGDHDVAPSPVSEPPRRDVALQRGALDSRPRESSAPSTPPYGSQASYGGRPDDGSDGYRDSRGYGDDYGRPGEGAPRRDQYENGRPSPNRRSDEYMPHASRGYDDGQYSELSYNGDDRGYERDMSPQAYGDGRHGDRPYHDEPYRENMRYEGTDESYRDHDSRENESSYTRSPYYEGGGDGRDEAYGDERGSYYQGDSEGRGYDEWDDAHPSHNDVSRDEWDEDGEGEKEPKRRRMGRRGRRASQRRHSRDDGEDQDEDRDEAGGFLEDTNPPTYINTKKLKLSPFGGKRKKWNPDDRKDHGPGKKYARYVTYALLIIAILMGFKNDFFPPNVLTPDDVATIVSQTTGTTNFPLEEGRGMATDFIRAYLSVQGGDNSLSSMVLSYYYGGGLSGGGDTEGLTRSASDGFEQTILYGPTIYSSKALTDYSAAYVVGALVQEKSGKTYNPPKWEFFSVGEYYNSVKKNFSIVPDSPSVVPAEEVGAPSSVPQEKDVGSENDDIANEVAPTVTGFIKAMIETSPQDHSTMDQYVVPHPDPSLYKGLNNEYSLAGSDSDAIQFQAFTPSGDEVDPPTVKIKATIRLRSSVGAEDGIQYTSTYLMFLERQTNGKYLISKFHPWYYEKSPDANSDSDANSGSDDNKTDESSTPTPSPSSGGRHASAAPRQEGNGQGAVIPSTTPSTKRR